MEDDHTAATRPHNIGFAVTWAVVIGFTCIVVGEMAQQYAGIGPVGAAARVANGEGAGRFNAIDYGATGAIRTPALSPCGPSPNGK